MGSQQQVLGAYNNGWQLDHATIGESMGHYFMKEDDADIWFVPLLNAASPPKKYPAHKLILKARSPVFYAQFYFSQLKNKADKNNGEIEEASNAQDESKKPNASLSPDGNDQVETIELPDVEPEAFEQFLRFCYTDSVEINGENAASILYIANRYTVKPLMEHAANFFKENLKLENACEMLQFSTQFNYEGVKEVEKSALEIIREKTEEVLKTEAFFGINSETLQLIVSQDNLAIKEIELFKALIRWGKKKQEDAENNGKLLRELITPALFHIQFFQLSIWSFGRFVVPTNVLTDKEKIYIFEKLSTKTDFFDRPFPFTTTENLRGGHFLTLEIQNVHEFTKERSEWITISGFSFAISAGVKQYSEGDDAKKHLGIFLYCKGPQPSNASKKWSCEAAYQLILVAKAPNQKDEIMMFTRRFDGTGNGWSNWGSSRFISTGDLLDPANGWVLEGNNLVTVKAKVKVLDRGDFEDAQNEV